MFSSINTIGNITSHIDVIYATIGIISVIHFNSSTTSAVLQTVTTTFSDSMDMNMEGHMEYEVAPLTTTLFH
jgi:hypothetical protein